MSPPELPPLLKRTLSLPTTCCGVHAERVQAWTQERSSPTVRRHHSHHPRRYSALHRPSPPPCPPPDTRPRDSQNPSEGCQRDGAQRTTRDNASGPTGGHRPRCSRAPPTQTGGLPRSSRLGASPSAPPPDPTGRGPRSAGPRPARGDRRSAPRRWLSPDTYVLAIQSYGSGREQTPPALAATAAGARRHRCRRSAPAERRAARQPTVQTFDVFSYDPHVPLSLVRPAPPHRAGAGRSWRTDGPVGGLVGHPPALPR